jgi:hypothetical protein
VRNNSVFKQKIVYSKELAKLIPNKFRIIFSEHVSSSVTFIRKLETKSFFSNPFFLALLFKEKK